MCYQGIPIIAEPRAFNINDEQSIKHYIGVSLAGYIENHINLNVPITLQDITCKFVDLNEDDYFGILRFNMVALGMYRFRGIENSMSSLEAHEYVKCNYKKLLLTCIMK